MLKSFKWPFFMTVLALSIFVCFSALADVVVTPPSGAEMQGFLADLLSLKGKGAAAIVLVVVQGLMLIGRQAFLPISGFVRLSIITVLTIASMVIASIIQGQSWFAALLDGAVLAAVQVYIHQVIKQIQDKKKA